MKIYYISVVSFELLFLFLLRNCVNIGYVSVLPLFLMALSAYQAYYFKRNRRKTDFNINNDADLTDEEWGKLSIYMSYFFSYSVPLHIPFVIFFNDYVKLLSLPIYLISFSGGALLFRIKHHKEYNTRRSSEARELEDQIRREELGKWK